MRGIWGIIVKPTPVFSVICSVKFIFGNTIITYTQVDTYHVTKAIDYIPFVSMEKLLTVVLACETAMLAPSLRGEASQYLPCL
jgi:hypothetical protein